MSNAPASQSDFDFWEFVNCGRCQLPFALGATVPFWLTECGHVVCNNHLNADQSCAQCGAQGVHLVPLQRELDAPMSEWFRPVPIILDNVAQAAKFQQETLASQIRYYKTRHQQQRVFIERLKREAAEVKKVNEVLDSENYQLRQLLGSSQQSSLGYSIQQPSDIMNSNGKRPMVDARLRPQTHSSPLSISSVGPNRLTLPPGQVAPNLLSNRRGEQDDRPPSENVHHSTRPPTQRQAGTFTEHYSYVPPSTPRLTQTHAAPRSLQQTRPNQEQQHYIQAPQALDPHGQHAVPTPAKFKPAKVTSASNNKPSPFDPHSQIHTHRHSGQQQGDMGPPPTPLHARRKQSASTAIHINHGNPHSASTSESLQAPPINTHPRINRVVPLNPIPAFLPQSQSQTTTPSTGISQRFMLPSAKASPRIVPFNMSGGNQRIPFVPGSRGGFT